MRALYTAATGMAAQQLKIDNVANNLSNVNTTGFKRGRVDFQDLYYENLRLPGTTPQGTSRPSGVQVGHGVRVSAIGKVFTEGNLVQTDGQLDMAVAGRGFFQLETADGETAYTRDGRFELDSERRLVNVDGLPIVPGFQIPEEAIGFSIENGVLRAHLPDGSESELGTMELASFANPAGLRAVGRNLFLPTEASGTPVTGSPGEQGFGNVELGMIEASNVDVAEELIGMIMAQRAYELTSKVAQTADEVLRYTNNLK